ncbi:MAG: exo-alpha-sialidase [Kiritimatiellales bacterium]
MKYQLFKPAVESFVIYKGQLREGAYGYNHDVSVEWFNGQFYAVWNAHPSTVIEGDAGQVNVLSNSPDFKNWSQPVPFLHEAQYVENPVYNPEIVAWQPNLLNIDDEELWCTWCYCHPVAKSEKCRDSGTYLSILKKGAERWVTSKIVDRLEINGMPAVGFPTQNPFRCSSGRVIAPMVFLNTSQQTLRDENDEKKNCMWDVCAYTDDGGKTWSFSNPMSRVDDHFGQWEPFFYEQADGKLRGIMRNFGGGDLMACTQWQMTTVGTGVEKGTRVQFNPDIQYAGIETGRARPQVFRIPDGRFALLMNDNFNLRGSRLNLSVFFSRSGKNDFVAGIPFSPHELYSTYPQGVEHDGKLYIAHTATENEHKQWYIRGAIIEAPKPDEYYLWPRSKRIEEWKWNPQTRGREREVSIIHTNPVCQERCGDRDALIIRDRSSCGVELDDVDWSRAGEQIEITFDFKISTVQAIGNLVLMSFGDFNSIRIGVPSNRTGELYAWSRSGWSRIAGCAHGEWHQLAVRISSTHFTVTLDGTQGPEMENPQSAPNAKLYFGDGFECDYVPSNDGSKFWVDLGSISTAVNKTV